VRAGIDAGADATVTADTDADRRTLRVWDPLVRLLHWGLVAGVVLGWTTTEWNVDWHQPSGWAALAIVGVRIVWGAVGPRHARFASFVRGPGATMHYARQAIGGDAPRHVGHNPLGGAMVIALFACIVGLALTGWLYTTDRFFGDEVAEIVHETLAWTLVALAALHVLGVLFANRHQRENLIAAMLDGRKRAPRGDDIA